MDERIARREECGSLAGVPIGVKDLEEVAGMATTFGSKAFRDNLAAKDAIEVARLRAAGAIVIGKTNTPEFGHSAFTRNLLFGLTRNPWNLERTPGGSSGGSAAAVASGMVPIATASDAGGSIRLPAAYTGCVGLKPSHGRIPAGPRMPRRDRDDPQGHRAERRETGLGTRRRPEVRIRQNRPQLPAGTPRDVPRQGTGPGMAEGRGSR